MISALSAQEQKEDSEEGGKEDMSLILSSLILSLPTYCFNNVANLPFPWVPRFTLYGHCR